MLSGLIGALLAKGLAAFEAAALGRARPRARRHGGRRARIGADHVMAGDVIEALPARPDRFGKVARLAMAELVREIMDAEPATVSRRTRRSRRWSRCCASTSCPGVPVVDGDGRCVGIVTEADLVLPDDQGDLHIPHYVNLFGGTVFLEPLGRFEERLRKAFASKAADMMTRDPDTVAPDTTVREAARLIHESGHNRLPVVEDGRLVGVVTRVDVLGALAA